MGRKSQRGNELRILNVVGNKPWGRRHGGKRHGLGETSRGMNHGGKSRKPYNYRASTKIEINAK